MLGHAQAVQAAIRAGTPSPRPPRLAALGLQPLNEEGSLQQGEPPRMKECLELALAPCADSPLAAEPSEVAAAAAEPPAAPQPLPTEASAESGQGAAPTECPDESADPPSPHAAQRPPPSAPHTAEKRPSFDVRGSGAGGGVGEPPAKRPKVPSMHAAAAGALVVRQQQLELSVSRCGALTSPSQTTTVGVW